MIANRRRQCDERVLVVWSYNLDNIIPTCGDFEEKLIKLLWNRLSTNVSLVSFNLSSSKATSDVNLTEKDKEQADTKDVPPVPALPAGAHNGSANKKRFWGLGSYFVTDKSDVEKTADGPSPRPVRLYAPVYNGLGVAMSICELDPVSYVDQSTLTPPADFITTGVAILLEKSLLDGNWTRFALLVTAPFLFCVSLVCTCSHLPQILGLT